MKIPVAQHLEMLRGLDLCETESQHSLFSWEGKMLMHLWGIVAIPKERIEATVLQAPF